MKRHLLWMVLSAGLVAQAEAASWTFTYQGFQDAETGIFKPDLRYTGEFWGEDADGNGIITLNELSALTVDNMIVLQPVYEDPEHGLPPSFGGCARDWVPWLKCEINNFSYDLTGKLTFHVSNWGNDEAWGGWGGEAVAGEYFSDYRYGPFYYRETRYLWTDGTTFTIDPAPVAAPVPEPALAALWLAGAGVVGIALNRRRV